MAILRNLTPAQHSIYYEQEIAGICANIGGHLRMPCRIDPALFAEAFRLLVSTNDALRLAFRVEDGIPQQWIDEDSPVTLRYVDMSAERDPEASAEEWMRASFAAPFADYTSGLFEGALVKAHDELYFYHAKGNHLILDGLSYALMGKRLIALYKGLREGNGAQVEAYPSALTFFAQEEEYFSSARYQEDRTYWLEQHKSSQRPLFGERKQSAGFVSTATQRASLSIASETYTRIDELGRSSGCGTASVLIAVLYLYLSRLFNREDIVLGLPVHNRGSAKLRDILGPLVNVNAARLAYDDALPFAEVVRRIAQSRRRDYRHQRYPINHLGRELGIYGGGRRRPFEIGFSFEPSDFDLEVDGIPLAAIHRSNGVQQMPMNFTLCEYGIAQDIRLHLDYQTSLVSEFDAHAHLERFEALLNGVLRDPNLALGSYSILSGRDRQVLRDERHGPSPAFEDSSCVHELFERQARRSPQHVAVAEVGGASLSYEELNRAANRLAHGLRESGIANGTRVGIFLDRSTDMLIAVLGLMKAGAVYVPLDKQWPADRSRFILADAGIELVLTTSSLMEACPLAGVDFLLLEDAATDGQWAAHSSLDITAASIGLKPDDPVYVLYTSGSTGRPKGAVIKHRGLVNYLGHAARHYQRPGLEGSVVSSPLSFDATITTLLTPLITGASVTLLPDADNSLVLQQLNDQLFDRGASRLFKITPAHLDALAANATQVNLDSQHVIVIGGEQLSAETLAPWRSRLLPGSTFVNEYGPTETVVGCSVYEMGPGQEVETSRDGAIPIGRPIQNTDLYVLNPNARAVCEAALQPTGAIGELYIGGVSLAREYLNRDALTAERFVADPFSDDPGARLYRTGDLVRKRTDGELEFLGRTDHQLKLRGYRIELGEIEARLREVPCVRDTVVVDRRDAEGSRYLVAYVTSEAAHVMDDSALVAECRSHLQQHLPEYMVPSAFIRLPELPLTANGKLDRNGLPSPEGDDFRHAAYIAPRNEREEQLCRLWAEVLGVERVGPHDNFFSLGGHSLKATRLISLIRSRLGIEVPLTAVFEHPTVARLAGEFTRLLSASILDGVSKESFVETSNAEELEQGEV